MKLDPKKDIRDLARFNQIMAILVHQGFGYVLDKIGVKKLFRRKKKREEKPNPKRLRITLERLGPTFIKLGQILSIRPDLLPKEYIDELGNLQDRVPPFPFKKAEKIIERELHHPINKLFLDFKKEPVASASISQVYKAKLKNGQLVAVKVQRPKVKEIMKTDIEIMFYVAKLLEKHFKKMRKYGPVGIVQEFKDWTYDELDFRKEAENAKKFYKNFRGSETVKIPKVYDKYSTRDVLVLEYIKGIELHNLHKVKKKKEYNIREIMNNGFDALLTQVFEHGFFHADPHPGNILILKDNKIAFIDFGIVGHFDDFLKKKSVELFYAFIEGDIDSMVNIFLEIGAKGKGRIDVEAFREDVARVVEPLRKGTLKEAKLMSALEQVFDVSLEHHIKPPVDFALFTKTILELEGIGLEYVPHFKFMDNARPFIEKLIKREFKISDMAKDLAGNLAKYGKLFKDLPDQLSSALRRIQRGKIKVDIEETDIKRLGRDIDVSANRLTYGLMVAAFLVAGALLTNMGEPQLYGFPLFSFVCFAMAFIFLIPLIISIQKEKNE
jgi:ubiquinone biosynthesis protein